MPSQFVLVVRDSRPAATVTTDIGTALSQGDSAVCQQLSQYFGAASGGSTSISVAILGSTTSGSATITATANPANADTVTIGGVAITFVAGTPAGSQVKIGGTVDDTLKNLIAFINKGGNANALAGIAIALRTAPLVVTIVSALPGIAGNSITLAESSTALAVSSATLLGGLAIASQNVISEGV